MCDRNGPRGCAGEDGEPTTPQLRADDVLAGSNGSYYTGWEVRRRLRAGEWQRRLRQADPDRLLVETDAGAALLLAAIDPEALPARTEVRIEGEAVRVVRRRYRWSRHQNRQYGRPDPQ
ncbi:hypothetical protein [Natronococcus occultus]|uniref:Uncharacterized protein n=1 Tax=Natronococcus occultus SP4 TaxID=694430 RepID=L0K0Z8_9EURY|nr:hypothetical protein [Natronococcus occultus]AGB38972.1 hypothetical protein Natoc_3234 [Natronococcus occultus SP4]